MHLKHSNYNTTIDITNKNVYECTYAIFDLVLFLFNLIAGNMMHTSHSHIWFLLSPAS